MSSRTESPSHAAAPGLAPFAQVLKSREVEDPVNLWVHRPLAYAFCRLVYDTPITPNQITLFAIALGLTAAACWVVGTPAMMLLGGALLWSSAIMDGADGMLARAKNLHSSFGRALDGSADMIVGLSTVAACLYHLSQAGLGRGFLALGLAATVTTVVQLNQYDFYKELHLRSTRIDRGGEGDTAERAARLSDRVQAEGAPWYTRASMAFYADYTRTQERLVRATNPAALGLLYGVTRNAQSADIYRAHNRAPMRLWIAVSLAPHSYLFAMAGMADRLDRYLWLRLTLMNALMLVAWWSQRRATRRTLDALRAAGFIAPAAD